MSRLRIRSLKPEFYDDEKIKAISRDARYVAIGLITRADDRGRQSNTLQVILGHIYPGGDVQPKQLERWLKEVVDVRFAREYTIGPFSYLWLPHFWRHQMINRPTESSLPPHPDDAYQHLPIKEAIKEYRSDHDREQLSEKITEKVPEFVSVDLTPPRAGARSAPFLSQGSTNNQGEGKVDAREREVFDAWVGATGRDATRTQFDAKRQRCIRKALASHGLDDCLAAVRNIGRDPWARGSNDRQKRFDDVKHALGDAERIERWRDWTPQTRPDPPASERKPWRAAGERLIAQQIGGAA
jgi:hypothetical protein